MSNRSSFDTLSRIVRAFAAFALAAAFVAGASAQAPVEGTNYVRLATRSPPSPARTSRSSSSSPTGARTAANSSRRCSRG